MPHLGLCSATELRHALSVREVSARELLGLYLERIERLNPQLNAVVTLDVEGAYAAADRADRMAGGGAGPVRPLNGLPITVKDAIETAHLRTTSGSPELSDHVPDRDAPAVARLRAAGAVIMGKTNLPAYAADGQTYNSLFGTTRNPWNPARTPGGSSGGSAAAVAAALATFDLGSDIGGSIRGPAHLCGIFGHKPTFGIVPTSGHIPPAPGQRRSVDMLTIGPLARSAIDIAMVLRVLTTSHALPPPRHRQLSSYRVAAWFDDPHCPIDDGVRACLDIALAALRSAGVEIAEETHPTISLRDHDGVYERLKLSALGGRPLGRTVEEAAADERRTLRGRWAEFFRANDVLLTPVMPVAAFPHDHGPEAQRHLLVNGQVRPYRDMVHWQALASSAYLPATVAPVGLTADGLPVGIQIIGPYREDHTPIAFAAHLERTLGRLTPPLS